MASEQDLIQASKVVPPIDVVTANDFRVRKFRVQAAASGHDIDAVPSDWRGKIVHMVCVGAADQYAEFAFSTNASAEVDTTVTSTDAGASAKVGQPLYGTQSVDVQIPATEQTVYFVREGTAALDIFMVLASD